MISLCAPTPELSCFGCCPPIRPSHYDPLAYASSLRREFSDNRRRFLDEGPRYRPIIGFHCWALGYLDEWGRRVGCLLHPCQNGGEDLRSLIDYGEKCRRESCLSSRMFGLLPREGQQFWLSLVRGLSAFYYSSRRSNPLFHLVLWGPSVLETLRSQCRENESSATELLHRHPFLLDRAWNPKADRFLFRLVLDLASQQGKFLSESCLTARCRQLRQELFSLEEVRSGPGGSEDLLYTHHLPLENDFLDLLRLGLGWRKVSPAPAIQLHERMIRLARSIDENFGL